MSSFVKIMRRGRIIYCEENHHCMSMKPIHVRFTIVYRTWIGTIWDLPPTVHIRYTSGITGARPVHVPLVYVMYFFTL